MANCSVEIHDRCRYFLGAVTRENSQVRFTSVYSVCSVVVNLENSKTTKHIDHTEISFLFWEILVWKFMPNVLISYYGT
jgi:hypothetical protein